MTKREGLKDQAIRFGHWHSIKAAEAAPTGDFELIGVSNHLMEERRSGQIPELGVAELTQTRIIGSNCWPLTAEGRLLPESTWFGPYADRMRLPEHLLEPKNISRTCVSLMSDHASGNFSHFLLDALPRIHLLEEAGIDWRSADTILAPKPNLNQISEFMQILNIDQSKILYLEPNDVIHPSTLIITSFPGWKRTYPSWAPRFLQERFGTNDSQTKHKSENSRIYISRSGYSRNAKNENELRKLIDRYGFEVIEPHAEISVSTMENTHIVLAAHGAGLANAAFARPGTTVIELVPSDHQFPHYYNLSMAAGLRYRGLCCPSTEVRDPREWGPSKVDFTVDIEALETMLETLPPGG